MSSEVPKIPQNTMASAEGAQNVTTSAENILEESSSTVENAEIKEGETKVESKEKEEEEKVTKEKEEDEEEEEEDECNENGCKVCNVTFSTVAAYHMHVRLTSHIQRLLIKQAPNHQMYCDVCCSNFANKEEYDTHMSGTPHQDKLRNIQEKHLQQVKMELEKKEKLAERVQLKADKKHTVEELRLKAEEWVRNAVLFTPGVTDNDVNDTCIKCNICEVPCSGVMAFKSHLEGARHNKKVRKLVETEVIDPDTLMKKAGRRMRSTLVTSAGRTLQIRNEIAECTQPLVGLEYITEYQGVDGLAEETKYFCDLCMSQMPRYQVISHVTGIKHRQKFFKEYDPVKYMILWKISRRSGKATKGMVFAQEVEDNEGRGDINVKIHQQDGYDPIFSKYGKNDDEDEYNGGRSVWKNSQRRRQPPSSNNRQAMVAQTILKNVLSGLQGMQRTQGSQRHYGGRYDDDDYDDGGDDGEMFGVDLHRRGGAGRGGGFCGDNRRNIDKRPADVEFIKRCITSCSQDDEVDTEIALHISNALTQGLLEFRLKNMDPTSVLNGELRSQFESLKRQNISLISNNLDNHDRSAMGRALREAQKLSLEMSNGDEKLMTTCLSILEMVNQKLSGIVDEKSQPPLGLQPQKLISYPTNPALPVTYPTNPALPVTYPTNPALPVTYPTNPASFVTYPNNHYPTDPVFCVSYPTNPYATVPVSSNSSTANSHPPNVFSTNNYQYNSFHSNTLPPSSFPSNTFPPNPILTNTPNPNQTNTFLSTNFFTMPTSHPTLQQPDHALKKARFMM